MPQPNPPKARLAFRVGVVGHRPNRLKEADLPALSKLIRNVLATVKTEVAAFRTSADAALYTEEQ